jgi:hypothetical protein
MAGSWRCVNLFINNYASAHLANPGRAMAIKQGRLADSTSFSNYVHFAWRSDTDLAYSNISLVPTVNISLIYPRTNNISVPQNLFFNVTVNITCIDAACGMTNITLYNGTNSMVLNATGVLPFYANDTNPLFRSISMGSRIVTFWVNATGDSTTDGVGTPFYNLGGMYGEPGHDNPATGGGSCPGGYTSKTVHGYPDMDYAASFCYVAYNGTPIYDFGGMYSANFGFVEGKSNPITGARSCPAGYTSSKVLGSGTFDQSIYFCYKEHNESEAPAAFFGGMFGFPFDSYYNPATGAKSCPAGYYSRKLTGTIEFDYPLYFCYQPVKASHEFWAVANTSDVGAESVHFNVTITEPNHAPDIYLAYVNSTSTLNLTSDNLTCWASGFDADNESINFNGRWYVNGVMNYSFSTTNYSSDEVVLASVFSARNTSYLDVIGCEVRSFDGYQYSDYLRSNNVTISPPPPEFTFVNPTPANASRHVNRSVPVNISIYELGTLANLIYNWNGTNTTMYNDSLILMYNFENKSSLGENGTYVVDMSRYKNNATVYGNAVYTSSGKYGGAYDFDGDGDYLNVTENASLNAGTGSLSVSAWIKANPLNADKRIIGKRSGNAGYEVHLSPNLGKRSEERRVGKEC